MIVPLKVSRSMMATQRRGSVKVFVHPNDSLEAMATLVFSSRSVRTWNSSSAPCRSSMDSVSLARREVPAKTAEITVSKALLDPLDLTGHVITFDAPLPP